MLESVGTGPRRNVLNEDSAWSSSPSYGGVVEGVERRGLVFSPKRNGRRVIRVDSGVLSVERVIGEWTGDPLTAGISSVYPTDEGGDDCCTFAGARHSNPSKAISWMTANIVLMTCTILETKVATLKILNPRRTTLSPRKRVPKKMS